MREFEKAEIDKMLADNVIEPFQTEWPSPIVFAAREDDTLRICVDYRKLDAVTKRDSYQIPRKDDCIDSLGDANIFSTSDADSENWQIEIEVVDRDKAALKSNHGLYRFIPMHFGLRNASTFQRSMDVVLSTLQWQFGRKCLNDIVVFSRTPEEQIKLVRHEITLLHGAGVTMELKKCKFFKNKIEYLDHVILYRRLDIASHKTDAICGIQPPTSLIELRSLLGFCNVSSHFLSNFAQLKAPLNKGLQKDEPSTFGPHIEMEMAAFNALQITVISPPFLALLNSS